MMYNDVKDGVLIPFCNGSLGMSGTHFSQLMSRVSSEYKYAHFVLCDTLDAYNTCDKGSPLWEEAEEVARMSADRWLLKHEGVMQSYFGNNYMVHRWDDIRTHKDFGHRFKLAVDLYNAVDEIKIYVNSSCQRYVDIAAKRISARGHVPNISQMLERSIAYMLEEIAGTATYQEMFDLPVIYLAEYFDDPMLIQRHNTSSLSMKLPVWLDQYRLDYDTLLAA